MYLLLTDSLVKPAVAVNSNKIFWLLNDNILSTVLSQDALSALSDSSLFFVPAFKW